MIALPLSLAQRLTNQVFHQDDLFPMRLVMRGLGLKVKADGATGGGFYLRKATNLFTRNHAFSLLLIFRDSMKSGNLRAPQQASLEIAGRRQFLLDFFPGMVNAFTNAF